ncbi:MAG TPA: multidrug effflux MFS transporter [Casimicrobiaceae bacterium]|nr:multidrug effflux MFS transporter [Casimicrobiaceae bacterium]
MLKAGAGALTLLLGALIALAPLTMDIYLASMPSMVRALSTTPDRVQLTLSVYMYAWGCAQLAAGPLSDRLGRRPTLLWGLGVFVVASAVCALSQSVWTLIGGRLVQGLMMAPIAVIPRAIARDLYAGERAAHILSLMGMVLGIAPIVAPIIGSHLHVWFGWEANFVFVAAFGAVLFVWTFAALPETLRTPNPRATDPRVIATNYARLLRSRRYLVYLLVAAFGQSGLFAFLAGSSFVFVSAMGRGETGFSWLFGSVMLGNLMGATLSSRLVRRTGIDRLIGAGTTLMLAAGAALAGLAALRVNHPLAVVAPMFVFMVALMMTMPGAIAAALTPFPDIAGSASSLLFFVQLAVASTAALIVGLTFDGSARPMALTICVAALGTFLSFRLAKRVGTMPG